MGGPLACIGALLWSALATGARGGETLEGPRDTDGPGLLQSAGSGGGGDCPRDTDSFGLLQTVRSPGYAAKGVDGSTRGALGGDVGVETEQEIGNQTGSQADPPAHEVCPGPSCGAPGS